MSRSAPGIEPSPIIPKHRNGTEHPKEGRSPTVSYALWTVQDLNLRPTGCKPDALPTELTVQKRERHTHLTGDQPRSANVIRTRTQTQLVTRTQNLCLRSAAGIEPAPQAGDLCSSLYGFCTRLSYALWTVQDSNL